MTTASARKGGRDPRWPWVPVIRRGDHTAQVKGMAFATRDEAVDYAQLVLDAEAASLARKLADPRYRALREQHGLPRELS